MILKDILAAAVGVGPNYKMPHQEMRSLLRLDNVGYERTWSGILEMYHTFPFLDYGSTIEHDEFTAVLFNHASPGGSKFDEWYNTVNPDGKKRRQNREGAKAYDSGDRRGTGTRVSRGAQVLYNYYENGTWPGPRLAVLIVDKMGDGNEGYGTSMSNVRYGFKAKLEKWDEKVGEYQDLKLTHLYINGCYVPMSPRVFEAANDYAGRLVGMIFRDGGAEYLPEKALQETLDKFGEDIFQVSAWQARREKAEVLQHS